MRRAGRRGMSPLTAGLIALGLIAIGTWFGFTKSNPFADPFEVKVAFKHANSLKPKSPVRVAGVNVGKVKSVESPGAGREGTLVTLEIDEAGLPLHRDATFKVRPRIFLEGNYFVDVQPGRPSSPLLADGDTVPVQQTASPVQFGQVLDMLQTDTREDLRRVLQEYGRAVDSDGGSAFNRAIRYWRPAFKNSAMVNDATRGVLEHDLSEYLAGATRVAEGLDRDPEALKGLITDLAATADAFAVEQANLSAAIRQLPPTLRQGRRTLRILNDAFPPLRRFVADMRPTVRSSGPALTAQLPFVRQLRGLMSAPELGGLVEDLRPLVPRLVKLNEDGVELQEEQRLLSSCMVEIVAPWQDTELEGTAFKSAGTIAQETSKDFVGLAGESRNFDANGQYVRSYAQNANYAYLLGDGRFYLTELPIEGVNPPKYPRDRPQPPLRADVPCETQERPDMRSRPAAPPPAVKINHSAPGVVARRAEIRKAMMEWMEEELKRSPLGEKLTLSKEPLKASEIDDVRRTLGDEAVSR